MPALLTRRIVTALSITTWPAPFTLKVEMPEPSSVLLTWYFGQSERFRGGRMPSSGISLWLRAALPLVSSVSQENWRAA
ncbi:hypothetical protein D3C71_2121380 [compost metagenome]